MIKKFKLSYLFFILLTTIFSIILISLIIKLYNTNDSYWLAVYSSWISIIASILFSTIISFVVQIINDYRERKDILSRRELIRSREIGILTNEMSNFLSLYHDNETFLLNKYKIKDSLIDNKLSINVIRKNMKILSQKLNHANKQNKIFIENYLLLSDSITKKYNEIVEFLNKKRSKFENINIDLNFEIFSKKEIDSLNIIPMFTKKYNNYYCLIDKFLKIVEVFGLKINFENNKWWTIITLLLLDNFKLEKK